jgi:cell division protein ZapA
MGENSKVSVKIYGQEYTIAGGDSGDRVVIVANHVDKMMNELAKGMPSVSVSSLAVLTAVNVTNDLFEAKDHIDELESMITNLKKDANHYIQLWEDAKASFKQYKEDAQNSVEQLQELQRIFNMKNVELNRANDTIDELRKKLDTVTEELEFEKEMNAETANVSDELNEIKGRYNDAVRESEKLKAKIKETENARSNAYNDASEIQDKYKELESSFFDIQMENLQLKNELDNLKKNR